MPGPELNKNTEAKASRPNGRRKVVAGIVIAASVVCIAAAMALNLPSIIAGTASLAVLDDNSDGSNIVPEETDAIYNNIFINGIYVGGLTREEALARLADAANDEFDYEINLLYEDKEYTYTLKDLNAGLDLAAAVETAYSVGRTGDGAQRQREIESTQSGKLELEAAFEYDKSAAGTVLAMLEEEINRAPLNATMERVNGQFVITPEQNGLEVDQERFLEYFMLAIEGRKSTDVNIPVNIIEPEFTEKAFKDATQLIGSYYTVISGSEAGRNKNLDTASDKINDYVLYPDEIFSTNQVFGPMTTENGYRMAPVIIGGDLTNGMGGGVCQVSSTLYMALLYAEVEIVERQNHSQKVGYADYGFDATLAGDYIDLKFKNDTGYPLTIESYIEGNKLYVNIYGYEVHDANRRLEFYNVFTGSVGAPAETIVEDPLLPLGERYVKTSARSGVNYELYKIVYDGNTEVSREQVNTSKYRARGAVVHVGTGEAVEAEPADVSNTPEVDGEGASTENPSFEPTPAETPSVEIPPAEATEMPYQTPDTSVTPDETPSPEPNTYIPVMPSGPAAGDSSGSEPQPVIVEPDSGAPSMDKPPVID